jgi:hypothetical protein
MKKIDKETYRLSSGREFYANGGLVSLAQNDDGTFEIREGYDGSVDIEANEYDDEQKAWSPEERRELADYMIALWTSFKESAS